MSPRDREEEPRIKKPKPYSFACCRLISQSLTDTDMDLRSQETNKDDEGATWTSSPSGDSEADDEKELMRQKQQRAGSGGDDDDDDDEGTRQPYKCTFCRRGFPMAQALGGHMNVHRRHRGRPAAPATAAPQGSSSTSCYVYSSTTTTTPVVAPFGQTHPSMAALLHTERQRPHELRLFGRDCAAAGRGKEGGGAGDVRRDRCYDAKDGDGGDHGGGEELDLELRLGGAAGS